jgi:hypothetical protein
MSLYWFGSPKSKTLRTILGCIDLIVVLRRTSLPALYWLTDKVGEPGFQVSYNRANLSLSWLQHYPMIFGLSSGTFDILTCAPSFVPDKVGWRNIMEGLRGHRPCLLGPLSGG